MHKFILLAMLLLAAACVGEEIQRGYMFNKNNLGKITPGETTQAEVLQALGSPSFRSEFEVERWHYVGQKGEKVSILNPHIEQQDVVTVEFDADGTVTKVERKTIEDHQDVRFVERTTPTEGNQFSMFEQLIGNFGRFNKSKEDAAAGP